MFSELILNLLAASKDGKMLKAKDIQEELSKAVIAITRHGEYGLYV